MEGPREHLLELALLLLVHRGPLRVRGHPVDRGVVRRVGHLVQGIYTPFFFFFTAAEKVRVCLGVVSMGELCRLRRNLKPSSDGLTLLIR